MKNKDKLIGLEQKQIKTNKYVVINHDGNVYKICVSKVLRVLKVTHIFPTCFLYKS